jgi:hypothetical protein
LADGEIKATASHGDGLPAKLGDGARIEFKNPGTEGRLVARVGDRLANVQRFEFSDSLDVLPQRSSDIKENFTAFTRSEIAPARLPGSLRRFHGGVHVRDLRAGDLDELFFGGGVDE